MTLWQMVMHKFKENWTWDLGKRLILNFESTNHWHKSGYKPVRLQWHYHYHLPLFAAPSEVHPLTPRWICQPFKFITS
jgi:hypothetical protein